MSQTIAEKISSAKVGRPVVARDYVTAPVDRVMLHEAFALSWKRLAAIGKTQVWNRIVCAHFLSQRDRHWVTGARVSGNRRAGGIWG